MMNDRPIDDPKLQAALDEVKAVMLRHGLAGACMLVSEDEAAFTYGLFAPWSAFQPDPGTPLGFRFRANSKQMGKDEAHRRVSGGMHTVCQLADFGAQTVQWMDDLKRMLRRAGIEFEHTSFGGRPLPHLDAQP